MPGPHSPVRGRRSSIGQSCLLAQAGALQESPAWRVGVLRNPPLTPTEPFQLRRRTGAPILPEHAH
eukprot:4387742-Alexandrium_andersonii.AAC.1